MRNRRLYAIVLLVALALLQARVAFAGCVNAARAGGQPTAGCCLEHAVPDSGSYSVDKAGLLCAPQCAESSDIADNIDARLVIGSHVPLPSATPPLRLALDYPADPLLPLTAGQAVHPPHTSLIYILQRLLI